MTTTCLLATVAALITLPVIVLLWATESPLQRQRRHCLRLHHQGHSQRAISRLTGIPRTTVQRRLAGAC